MIIYGLTMQGKPEEVPKEVATWLLERNLHYPNIDFTIDCRDPHPSQVEEFESAARKYSRLYYLTAPFSAGNVLNVLSVAFLYLKQVWSVKIVGGLDSERKIADRAKAEVVKPLPLQLRAEIAGLPTTPGLPIVGERVSENTVGMPRREDEAPLEKPTEMVSLPPDLRWTSELSLSGEEIEKFAQFAGLLLEPDIQKEAERAIRAKDWETLKRLQNRKRN